MQRTHRVFTWRSMTGIVASILIVTILLGAVLKQGSRGEDVKRAQQKLISLGYLKGKADGIYGANTKKAVIAFQKAKGLTADGKIGPSTAKALGITLSDPTGASSRGAQDAYLLARLVYAEARGEPYKGQVAVAAVVLNRVKHPSFPNTISGVIYQPGAFSVVRDGQINLKPDSEAIRAANDALNGFDPTNGCVYYYNPKTATDDWIFSRTVVTTIGNHRFAV